MIVPGLPAAATRTWAVVAFRGRRGGKRRLAGLLDADERSALALAMLADVLAALSAGDALDQILVVTASGRALLDVDASRVRWVADPELSSAPLDDAGRLNAALSHGQRLADRAGVGRVLILPADLPSLSPADVAALLEADPSDTPASVVIGPDRALVGTNALLLRPPRVLEPRFGVDSYRAHLSDAASLRLPVASVRRGGLSLDVDTPADLEEYLERGRRGATGAVIDGLGIARRLDCIGTTTGGVARR